MTVVRRETSPEEVELEVKQNLKDDAVADFRAALYEELDRRLVRVNLAGVQSINSAALGTILLFQKRLREQGGSVRLEHCSEELRKTFLAIRLDTLIEIR